MKEYLIQFTDDPLVKESLRFLMTREIAHFQMFSAALQTIEPNFPPGILQGDPRFTHAYFNMSDGADDARGPWNEGNGPWQTDEQWEYIDDPVSQVQKTEGQLTKPVEGTSRTDETIQEIEEDLSAMRSEEVKQATPTGQNQWSEYRR